MKLLGWLLAGWLITACTPFSITPQESSPNDWRTHYRAVSGISDWDAVGRASLRTETDAWHATLQWRQRGDSFRIRLSAPLSQGTMQLTNVSGQMVLRDTDNRVHTAADADRLVYQVTGWQLPVAGLVDWMLGLPGKHVDDKLLRFDRNGRLERFYQDEWEIALSDYTLTGDHELPGRVHLQREGLDVQITITRRKLTI